MIRSKEKITRRDLRKLLKLSREDIDEFFLRNPKYEKYRNRERLVALCQGAALHYIDEENGIKDFDVWYFYPDKTINLPYRRRGVVDFGESKFGKYRTDAEFKGRTIDVLMRSDPAFRKREPGEALIRYFSESRSKSAQQLSQKAVIRLYPEAVFGKVLWPIVARTCLTDGLSGPTVFLLVSGVGLIGITSDFAGRLFAGSGAKRGSRGGNRKHTRRTRRLDANPSTARPCHS